MSFFVLHFMMTSSSGDDFNLFEAIFDAPDLLELVVKQCSGKKNNLRLACSRLRAAVDACVTELTWMTRIFSVIEADRMVDLARCPQLHTLDFRVCRVDDLSPLASCLGLRRINGVKGLHDLNLAPLAALPHLERLDCDGSFGLSDISALIACKALKYLQCRLMAVTSLPPLPVSLETLICYGCRSLSDISALVACTSLKHLNCCGCGITIIPPLPSGLEILNISGTLCTDLSALAACSGLRSLDCVRTQVHDLSPLAACKQLEYLDCDHFYGVDDQSRQLLQARPDVIIRY